MPANPINAADLITEFGAYFQDRGQRQEDLYRCLYVTGSLEDSGRVEYMNDNRQEFATYDVQSQMQSFNVAFQPSGTVEIAPRVLKMHKIKQDEQVAPDLYSDSWLGFMEGNDLNRAEWPMIGWLLREFALKAKENWVKYEEYLGIRAENAGGAVAANGNTIDGWNIIMNRDIDEGLTVPFALGAIPTGTNAGKDFVLYVREFIKSLPTPYQAEGGEIKMRFELEALYREGVRSLYNVNYMSLADNTSVYDYPQFKVKGYVEQGASDKIWYTPKRNMLTKIRKNENINKYRIGLIAPGDREVWWSTDFYKGKIFVNPKEVFTSDQDTALPV